MTLHESRGPWLLGLSDDRLVIKTAWEPSLLLSFLALYSPFDRPPDRRLFVVTFVADLLGKPPSTLASKRVCATRLHPTLIRLSSP